jgi:hypothetical protein
VQAAKATSSSAPAPRNDRMVIRFTEDIHKNRFGILKNREIKSTKWACPTILNQLGMTNDFNLLCNRVGLFPFVFQDAPTYHRLTLKFLCTLMHTVNNYVGEQGAERVHFRLMNCDFDVSFTGSGATTLGLSAMIPTFNAPISC